MAEAFAAPVVRGQRGELQDGALNAVTQGRNLAAHTVAHTWNTSWTQLESGFSTPTAGFILTAKNNGDNSAETMIQIARGAASSEQVILDNWMMVYRQYQTLVRSVFIPIPLPASTRIAARARSSDTTGNVAQLVVEGIPAGFGPAPQPIDAESRGENLTSASRGTTVDPGGTANTLGSWADLGAVTSFDWQQIIVAVNADYYNRTGANDVRVQIGQSIGGGTDQVLFNQWFRFQSGDDVLSETYFGPYPVRIPKGAQIAARAANSITTVNERELSVMVYGFG